MTSTYATIETAAIAPEVDSFCRAQLHVRRGAAASAEAAAALALIDVQLMTALRRIARVERDTLRCTEAQRLETLITRTYAAARLEYEFDVA